MNDFLLEALKIALGAIAGAGFTWGVFKTKVNDHDKRINSFDDWRLEISKVVALAADARREQSESIKRVESDFKDRERNIWSEIKTKLSREEYEPRHTDLQQQIHDLKRNKVDTGTCESYRQDITRRFRRE